MLGKEAPYGSRKHFDCSSEISFEECTSYIEGSSLWSKVVFAVIRTGGKNFSGFCKSGSTTVEGSDCYDEKVLEVICIVWSYDGCRMFR